MTKLQYILFRIKHDNQLQAHIMIAFCIALLVVSMLSGIMKVDDSTSLHMCAGCSKFTH